MKSLRLSKYDLIFLSYDEPNADENYDNLKSFIPYAKRVHGVEGSDSAHKACARLSTTERFIVVDGDNFLVKHGFENQKVIINDNTIDVANSVISWPSYNIINGLVYGNGGIKCWSTDTALSMKTHEHCPTDNLKSQVDFCWDINYIPLDVSYSEIRNNATPMQAWRAGFREGVKMSLDQGLKVDSMDKIWHGNLKRLLIWMTVGQDIKNGIWSILGARQGCYMTNCTDWNHINVRDFTWLKNYWNEHVEYFSPKDVLNEIERLEQDIKEILDIPKCFTEEQSKFFKKFNFNPSRQHKKIKVIV